MDHIVYVDARTHELEKILDGTKTMVARGATRRLAPHGRVCIGDRLFFIRDNGEGLVRASAVVTSVFNSSELPPEEVRRIVEANQDRLQLSPAQMKRCQGKCYLVLVEFNKVAAVTPFRIYKATWAATDDWLVVDDISQVAAATS